MKSTRGKSNGNENPQPSLHLRHRGPDRPSSLGVPQMTKDIRPPELELRKPKKGRITGNNYYRNPVEGKIKTMNKVAVEIRMHPNFLAILNEAWLRSDERYFSRFIVNILRRNL